MNPLRFLLRRAVLALMTVTVLCNCAAGPDYHRPATISPTTWRVGSDDTYWRQAKPAHAWISTQWWQVFGSASLDKLEARLLKGNASLQAAAAHYEQAQAVQALVGSRQFPQLNGTAGVAREKISANRPLTSYDASNISTVQNDARIVSTISYEADLFGGVRRQVEAARAAAGQAAADLADAQLVLTAQLAADYFALRELDAEDDVFARSLVLEQKALDFVSSQHDLGAASGLEVLQQRAQLNAARTQAQLLREQRARYASAIAVLIGTPAPEFSLASEGEDFSIPVLPTGVPSELLQRRPDIASAERAMAAANARIGVARAAYFPDLTLSSDIGWEATRFASLLSAPSVLWSIGASASLALFDGGQRRAQVDFAKASYAKTEADYRQTVLQAFAQVQDAVTGLSILHRAAADAHQAVIDARQSFELADARYQGGLVAFIDVVSAQQSLLTSELQQARIRGRQAALTVYLAKALGGGWSTGDIAQGKAA